MDFWTIAFGTVVIILIRRFVQSFFPTFLSPNDCAILITGCDTGFGHDLAIRARRFGFYVFACCFSKTSDGASTLEKVGCLVLEMDVTKQETIDAARERVDEQLRARRLRLHGIVNNAGVNVTHGPMEWVMPELVEKTLNVNTLGAVRVTRAFLPFIRAAKGRIVNMCSMLAHVATPNLVPYCLSKSANFMFSNGLRRELSSFGVRVSTISPWVYNTPFIEASNAKQYAKNSWDGATPEARGAYGAGNLSFEEYFSHANKKHPNLRSDLDEVIDCMIDALTNENPKADYIPDVRSRILAFISEVLPIYWVDKIFLFAKVEKRKKEVSC